MSPEQIKAMRGEWKRFSGTKHGAQTLMLLDALEQAQAEIEQLKQIKAGGVKLLDRYVDLQYENQRLQQENEHLKERKIMIHINEDGTLQLKDDLSRWWCACGKPAVVYFPENVGTPYDFKCSTCAKNDSAVNV